MEIGKHIIVFITAILMPFMAYGADSATYDTCTEAVDGVEGDEAKKSACNLRPGCGWIVMPEPGHCEPCVISTYNKGGGNSGCIDCTNAPKGCGTYSPTCNWMQDKAYTGLKSNTCPWEMNKVDMTITYLGEPIDISATLSNVDDVDTTGDETKLVIKTSDQNEIFSTISKSFNNNQIDFEIQLNDGKTCTINSMIDNSNQWTLVSNVCSLSETQISSLTVKAKKFYYVFVPTNSVESDNVFSVVSAGNASGVKEGFFGAPIDRTNIDEKVTFYQYNNCEYYDSTVNCKDISKPEKPSDQIDYGFKYIDKYKDADGNQIDTIIVLELHCPADSYCSDYKTIQSCPLAFSSAKDSATSITDCYLDSSVTFIDNNNKNNPNGDQLIPEGTKVYYQGNSTQ